MTPEETQSEQTPFLSIPSDDKDGRIPIYFQEDWAQGIGGGLWSTGLALGKYLTTAHAAANLGAMAAAADDDEGISALELGSGNGLVAVCLLAMARRHSNPKPILKRLVITDLADHLPLIQKTLDANPHLHSTKTTCRVHVLEHDWGQFTSTTTAGAPSNLEEKIRSGQHKFDWIVGSDLAYHSDLYDVLIASLQQYSHANTVILLGVTMVDTKPEFFHKLRRAGFQYRKFADHLLDPDFQGRTFGIFVIQKRSR